MLVWLIATALVAGEPAKAEPPSTPATAQPELHLTGVTGPDWLTKPGPNEFNKYWPKGVKISGGVTLTCIVKADGTLTDCKTSEESPQGMGFGDAALNMSQFFQMRPMLIEGEPITGGTFTFRIFFKWPGSPPPQGKINKPETTPPSTPDPK
jgi:protein TonB